MKRIQKNKISSKKYFWSCSNFLLFSLALLTASIVHTEESNAATPDMAIPDIAIPDISIPEPSKFTFNGSGFLTAGAGKMLGGTRQSVLDLRCPCFTADYAQNAIYDDRSGIQFGPDSKLGLQGTVNFPSPDWSVTAQAVSRGSEGGEVNLEWLYGTYWLNDSTSIQFGRKRLPILFYSDSQDVGFALPWTHLPPQQYGWEVVNYNGINIQHVDQLGSWDVRANMLAGHERVRDSGYWKVYRGQQSRTRVRWENIFGGNVTLAKDWFEARLSYIQAKTTRNNINEWDSGTQTLIPSTDPLLAEDGSRQKIYVAAFNVDYENWLLLTEFLHIDRQAATFNDFASRVGLIRRMGEWEAGINWSEYYGKAVVGAGGNPQGQESHSNRSLTVRHYLSPHSDIKIQLDYQRERGGVDWTPKYGHARLLTLAYDRIF